MNEIILLGMENVLKKEDTFKHLKQGSTRRRVLRGVFSIKNKTSS